MLVESGLSPVTLVFEDFKMEGRLQRKDILLWVKVPEDLKAPETFEVPTNLLTLVFGPNGSRIPYLEQVSQTMLELKVLECSNFTRVVVYGPEVYKLRAKGMFQSLTEWHRLRQERGMQRLDEAMNTLELGLGLSEGFSHGD
ncbi:PREDICTED: developmental pluripotency-associated 5 protein-like [Elephantulus edwardii]|uniref:developmental pluripotency-associated 5 protein-like n=1 Tax=Elephantulus edwardii TaxID=28737 RepID=UPI0003F07EAB|nr:PREDICTED: developmental pluripotency-associated 5 protein-like [Elephantulus edwardii]